MTSQAELGSDGRTCQPLRKAPTDSCTLVRSTDPDRGYATTVVRQMEDCLGLAMDAMASRWSSTPVPPPPS